MTIYAPATKRNAKLMTPNYVTVVTLFIDFPALSVIYFTMDLLLIISMIESAHITPIATVPFMSTCSFVAVLNSGLAAWCIKP